MNSKHWLQYFLFVSIVGSLIVAALLVLMMSLLYPTLPSLEALTDYHPKLPLRVFDAEGSLIGEFGQERRAFVPIEQTPKVMKDAILAIEDRRFYKHGGIDTKGILRAIRNNVTGRGHEGASTITMQVAKNFFSEPDTPRNIWTKIKEALLAIKIENAISKDKILELYLNQIYLGERAYGFATAAKTYFDKDIKDLNLAEAALLAGLPKAPSKYNPLLHPKFAISRQHEVLRDMQRYGFINEAQFNAAMAAPLKFQSAKFTKPLGAEYVSEIVRATLYKRYGEQIYSSGLRVYTTIHKSHQQAANLAMLQGLINFELRHGFRGPEKRLTLSRAPSEAEAMEALREFVTYNQFVPALVTQVAPNLVKVITKNGLSLSLQDNDITLVKNHLNAKAATATTLKPGAVIRVYRQNDRWSVVQLPEVESALIAINPETGGVNALVGGFSFERNKYNHVTQARRQPGSSFKPFIYAAALEKGYTPASVFEDAPISFSAEETGSGKSWTPQNYDEKYAGPMRMREALVNSKNTISIRLMRAIGAGYAQTYIRRFGFDPKDHPPYLSTALGAGTTTVWQLAAAYATFANSGYRVQPYLIEKIVDSRGKVLQAVQANSHVSNARVIDPRNAFIVTSMLQDVIRDGTAKAALSLGRPDIAGKTGTTNDQNDAWFAGYHPKEVAVAWVGYDNPQNLGKGETGGRAALPIWIKYMQETLRGVPVYQYKIPDGVLQLKVDANTGMQVNEDDPGIYEYFYEEHLPNASPEVLPGLEDPDPAKGEEDGPSFLDRLIGDITSGNNEDRKLPVNPAARMLGGN